MSAAAPTPSAPVPLGDSTRRWLWISVLGIALYVVLDIVAQLLPPHYSAISQAESDLAVGPYGYVMTVNFVVRGVLSLAFLAGLAGATGLVRRARIGAALVGVWAVGAFVLAAFPTDVGTPLTLHGTIHLITGLVAFAGGAVGELLLSAHFAQEPRLASLRTAAYGMSGAAILMVLLTFGSQVVYRQGHLFGLLERIFIGLVLLWMLVTALQLLRAPAPSRA